jgi:DoxX-like family
MKHLGGSQMDREATQSRTRRLAGNILVVLPGVIAAMSELMKLARVPRLVNYMAAAGFSGNKISLVAVLGLSSVLLFWYPRTRSIGVLLLSAFLGGAICLHVQRGEYGEALGPAMLLVLAWIGTVIRHPQVLWSLADRPLANDQLTEATRESLASGRG